MFLLEASYTIIGILFIAVQGLIEISKVAIKNRSNKPALTDTKLQILKDIQGQQCKLTAFKELLVSGLKRISEDLELLKARFGDGKSFLTREEWSWLKTLESTEKKVIDIDHKMDILNGKIYTIEKKIFRIDTEVKKKKTEQ